MFYYMVVKYLHSLYLQKIRRHLNFLKQPTLLQPSFLIAIISWQFWENIILFCFFVFFICFFYFLYRTCCDRYLSPPSCVLFNQVFIIAILTGPLKIQIYNSKTCWKFTNDRLHQYLQLMQGHCFHHTETNPLASSLKQWSSYHKMETLLVFTHFSQVLYLI